MKKFRDQTGNLFSFELEAKLVSAEVIGSGNRCIFELQEEPVQLVTIYGMDERDIRKCFGERFHVHFTPMARSTPTGRQTRSRLKTD